MKKVLFLLIVSVILTSCATIINNPYKTVTIHTREPGWVVYQQDTIPTKNNKVHLNVERRKAPIELVALTDSLTKSFEVPSKKSFWFWSNIYFNYGVGLLVDMDNPKRFTYPANLYVNPAQSTKNYTRFNPAIPKGTVQLHISVPYINTFQMRPEAEATKINTGFFGLALGADYYHATNQYLNLTVSGATDFMLPFPAPIDISGEDESLYSLSVSLSNNHRINRFSLGYGLSYARNIWDLSYHDRFGPTPPTRDPIRKSHDAVGLVFPAYVQLGESFHLGLVYRPTFFRPGMNNPWAYEHLISLDLTWKIKLR